MGNILTDTIGSKPVSASSSAATTAAADDDKEWAKTPANLDTHRNTFARLVTDFEEACPLWSCQLWYRKSHLLLREEAVRNCERAETQDVEAIAHAVAAIHRLFDHHLPQGVMLPLEPATTDKWQPFPGIEPNTSSETRAVPELRLPADVGEALKSFRWYSSSTDCHVWVGRQSTFPWTLQSLNLQAYRTLADCGAPRILLAADSQPYWLVSHYCGDSVAEWERTEDKTDMSALSWHQFGGLIRENLRKVHTMGWAIRTPVTPASVWFDCEPYTILKTERPGELPPFGVGHHSSDTYQWCKLHGAYFVDLRLAGPATEEEQAADVDNLRCLFESSFLSCEEFGE